ncbi:MAG: ThiF family adenylyltransferase [Acidimicrobiaceae bacterium]|nr:ThiF family adenylyltransferase [Acidimicrobiaceae bacterium]
MAARAVTEAVSLRLPAAIMDDLQAHLFRDDGDEHGAVIGASVLRTERGLRLIGRRLFLAQDGVDYVPGIRGYRRLTPEFVRRCVRECAEERLAYLAVHNHFGTSRVAFSADDLASHRRGYPALIDILDGPPAGALVFAQDAVAGDVWLTHEEQAALDCATVLAPTPRRLYPEPQRPPGADARYDRQVRLFGDRGQHILAMQRVGIVGLGGGVGSLINEYLARLGVGHIVAIDDDRIDETNYPRLVGSRPGDLGSTRLPRVLARWFGRPPTTKVVIAERLALDVMPDIGFDAVEADVVDHDAVQRLVDCDAVFLAADTMRARLVINALCHQYLIPVWQVGTKIQVDADEGDVEDVFSVVRHLVPGQSCLWCTGLIDRTQLAEESASPQQRDAQRYIAEVPAPSVVTLNAVAAAHAVNDYLLTTVGLTASNPQAEWMRHHPLQRRLAQQRTRTDEACTECQGRLGAGPLARLPVKAAGRS